MICFIYYIYQTEYNNNDYIRKWVELKLVQIMAHNLHHRLANHTIHQN
jgi:hypothetical protein